MRPNTNRGPSASTIAVQTATSSPRAFSWLARIMRWAASLVSGIETLLIVPQLLPRERIERRLDRVRGTCHPDRRKDEAVNSRRLERRGLLADLATVPIKQVSSRKRSLAGQFDLRGVRLELLDGLFVAEPLA